MSSWTRDMAKKPPSTVESMPVFDSPPAKAGEAPALMRVFEPFQSRIRAEKPALVVQPYTQPKTNELMNTFEIPKKVSKPDLQLVQPKPQQPKTQQPTWEPLDVKKKNVQVAPPALKQLPRPSDPQISVLIDVKDNTDYTESLLQSIVRQTYNKWVGLIGLRNNDELVRVRLNESLVKLQLSNIVTVVELKDSLSLTDSYKHLLTSVETPYVAFSKNTDLWVSKKLEKQMELLQKDPALGVVGTMSRFFGDKLELVDIPPGLLNLTDFITNNPIVFSSVLVKREHVDFTNEFANFDYECWSKLVKDNVKMSNVADILTLQRVHSSISTFTKDDKEEIRRRYGL